MENMILSAPAEELKVRDRLLAAATRLFAEKGYTPTSVSEIVAAAGVTKPTLYYYFKNKEGIYLEILHEAHRPWVALLEEVGGWEGSARERILRLAVSHYDMFMANLQAARMIVGIFYGPAQDTPDFDFEFYLGKYQQTIRNVIDSGMTAGEIAPCRTEDVMQGMIGLIWMVMDFELCRRPGAPGREGMVRIINLFFEGIAR